MVADAIVSGPCDPVRVDVAVAGSGVAHIVDLVEPDGAGSDLCVLEEVRLVARRLPCFVHRTVAHGSTAAVPAQQDLHGSYLVQRRDVVLFGPSIQVLLSGRWATESRAFGEQFLDMVASDSYRALFPGPKPLVGNDGGRYSIDLSGMDGAIEGIAEPVFLATPLEPTNWGRWLLTVAPKVQDWKRYGQGRKFLCTRQLAWQREFLQALGVQSEHTLDHDPGRTYRCADLMTVSYSVTNLTVSAREREMIAGLVDRATGTALPAGAASPKLFISRRKHSQRHAHYRVLQNEDELILRMQAMGFLVVEPEGLPFFDQIRLYAQAEIVVGLGGAAIFNAMFCRPACRYLTIESSDTFLRGHCEFLSSLGLTYGVLVGRQDEQDETIVHKRWTVDLDLVATTVMDLEQAA